MPRALAAKVQAKAEQLLRNAAVRIEVRNASRVPETVVIDANANVVYAARMKHRRLAARTMNQPEVVLDDLEQVPTLRALASSRR